MSEEDLPNSVPALFDGGSDGSGIIVLKFMSLQGVTKKCLINFDSRTRKY